MRIRLPIVTGTWKLIGSSGEEIYGTPNDPMRAKYQEKFKEVEQSARDYHLGSGTVECTAPSFPQELLDMPDCELLDDTVITFEKAVEASAAPKEVSPEPAAAGEEKTSPKTPADELKDALGDI